MVSSINMISGPQSSRLSRLFSNSLLRELSSRGKSGLFARLIAESGTLFNQCQHVADAFEYAFRLLSKSGLRDEYVYRSALVSRILLGRHSLNTACMLSEYRVDNCKADVVILNGTSTVYEIKSERDSLNRLEKQLEAYRKVFARVYVVASEDHVDAVKRVTSTDIGILQLSRRQSLTTIREALNRPERIQPEIVFESLRTTEAKLVLQLLNVNVPEFPNTEIRRELKRIFANRHPKEVHDAMVTTLKRCRNLRTLESLMVNSPPSLQAGLLSITPNKREQQNFLSGIGTRLPDALDWA